jgi:hypothetical protein
MRTDRTVSALADLIFAIVAFEVVRRDVSHSVRKPFSDATRI